MKIHHALFVVLFNLFDIALFGQFDHLEKQVLGSTGGKKFIRWEKTEDPGGTRAAIIKTRKGVGIYEVSLDHSMDEDSFYVYATNTLTETFYSEIGPFQRIPEKMTQLFDDLQWEVMDIAEVRHKKKKGIIVRFGTKDDTEYKDATDFFENISFDRNLGSSVPVQKKGDWGLYDWFQQEFIFNCIYPSLEALPKTNSERGFNEYSARIFLEFNEALESPIDWLDLDPNNGDGILRVRDMETKKWGMYQYLGPDYITEAIPMNYDSLQFFFWNGEYTPVYLDGKVGFYLSYWVYGEEAALSVPCIYEDYRRFNAQDGIERLAVQKDGKWGWVDWLTGKPRSEFQYDTPEGLPYPYFKQDRFFED